MGRAVRTGHQRPVRIAKRDHDADRGRTPPRPDRGGGRPRNRAPRRAGIYSAREGRFPEPPSRANFAEGVAMYERALGLDPGSVMAQSLIADTLAGRVLSNNTPTGLRISSEPMR